MRFLPYGLAGEDAEMKFYFPRDPSHVSCSTLNLQQTNTWFSAQCYRLSTLMKMQGDARIDLLKLDIEGGEYAVLDDLIASNLFPRLMLIEFDEAHTPLDDGAIERITDRIRRLENAGMRCISVAGCNATFIHNEHFLK
jgi:Methyltransferase FkbM domain